MRLTAVFADSKKLKSVSDRPLSTNHIVLLFVASGFSALIYEVVWFHLLRLAIGSSFISVVVLLTSFLGGMCIGSLLFHRYSTTDSNPLKVYAGLEAMIGAFGILIPLVLPLVSSAYFAVANYGGPNLIIRSCLAAIILLPPTILMGATIPAISRWTHSRPGGAAILARLYGANALGAFLGAAAAGFVLLERFDVYVATGVAVAVNALIAAISLRLSRHAIQEEPGASFEADKRKCSSLGILAVVAALSGSTALAGQVLWTRSLSMLIGATVYSFTLILAVFLAGIGLGGFISSTLIHRYGNALRGLAVCQLLLIPAVALGAWLTMTRVAAPDIDMPPNTLGFLQVGYVLKIVVAILPATLIWGASLPYTIAAVTRSSSDPAREVGYVYAANTLGAIVSIVAVSLWLIPAFGTQTTAQLVILLCAAAIAVLWFSKDFRTQVSSILGNPLFSYGLPCAILVVVITVIQSIPPVDAAIIGFGRNAERWGSNHQFLHVAEGRNASVAVAEHNDSGARSFHIGGKSVASTISADMRLQRILGHLPALIHEEPKSVLVVGLGAGVTAGSFVPYESVERIVIVEIEPEVANAAALFFSTENYDVLKDPRTEVVFDDARHYLATTDEAFDIVTADPIHPWLKGAAALYTEEFFELLKSRLRPGGLVTQWVPLYETNATAVKSEIGTFFTVFPEGSIWNSQSGSFGYDLVMLAGDGPMSLDFAQITSKLSDYPEVANSLSQVGIENGFNLLTRFAGNAESTAIWLHDFELNLDRNLRLEYLAGQSLNLRNEQAIFSGIIGGFQYSDGLFKAGSSDEQELRKWFLANYQQSKH